mgnify:CR=1 FL=1
MELFAQALLKEIRENQELRKELKALLEESDEDRERIVLGDELKSMGRPSWQAFRSFLPESKRGLIQNIQGTQCILWSDLKNIEMPLGLRLLHERNQGKRNQPDTGEPGHRPNS